MCYYQCAGSLSIKTEDKRRKLFIGLKSTGTLIFGKSVNNISLPFLDCEVFTVGKLIVPVVLHRVLG